MKSLINTFEQKLEYIFTDFNENSRGYAWYDLNDAFGSEKHSVEQKAKELFIYLANWGMVARGSFLMKHTWRILRYIVEVLQKSEYKDLRNPKIETVYRNINLLITLRDEIDESLRTYHDNKIVSYTLISKIILGTLGCTVAYDKNVRIILSATGIASAKFDDDSIKSLCEYYMQNRVDFERLRKKVEERTKKNCPPFKLLDLILYSAANMDSSDGSEE